MNIVVTGEWLHADFADVVKSLGSTVRFCELSQLDSLEASPDLLIFAQARRHQLDDADSEKLLGSWPAVPAVALLSSWCEGEVRSGKPLAGWTRVLWHRWPAEFARFVAARQANLPTKWDRVVVGSGTPVSNFPGSTGGRCYEIGLYSRWNSESLAIEQLLLRLGHGVRRRDIGVLLAKSVRPDEVSLIVGDSCDAWMEQALADARLVARRALKIILMGFPRRQEIERLRQIGGRQTAVLAKPFEMQQLQLLLQTGAWERQSCLP